MTITLTPELLTAAMGCTASVAHVWANALDDACDTYTIDTPERMAPFIAQLGEESGGLSVLVESLNYTPERLLAVFGEARISAENAQRYGRTADHVADQEAIANIVYGGDWGRKHLGNTQPGDGWKFRGRGPIQTSGRFNMARVTTRLREKFNGVVPDFEEQPELLEMPRWGALAAADYWADHGLNALADIGNFEGITRAINGGLTNQASRLVRWHRAEKALQQFATTRVPAPAPVVPAPTPAPSPAQPTEDDLQSGRAYTQPENTMAIPVIAYGAKALLSSLAGTLIETFTPLAREKIQNEIARHTDRPEIVEQLTDGIITAAKVATGMADPVQAVAQAAKSPALIQQIEVSALETLSRMAPLLDQLAKLDAQRWAADDASQTAAAERARGDAADIAPMLATWAVRGLYAMIVMLVVVVVSQIIWGPDHKPSGELMTLLGALMMLAANKTNDVYSYRFGTTRQSAAKDVVISEISKRK